MTIEAIKVFDIDSEINTANGMVTAPGVFTGLEGIELLTLFLIY